MDVFFTANSPGELSSWVQVTAAALRQEEPRARVVVALVPCPYASGGEARVARGMPEVDHVLEPATAARFALGLGGPGLVPAPRGVVVFMGGEPWHAMLLARRLGYPLVGYVERPSGLLRHFRAVGLPDEALRRQLLALGVPAGRVHVVGSLTAENVLRQAASARRSTFGLAEDSLCVGLFPGSRPIHLRASLAPMLKACEMVAARQPGVSFLLALSGYVSSTQLQRSLDHPFDIRLPVARGRVEGDALLTEGGLRIPLAHGRPYEVMGVMDVGCAIPGTNTAEMACLGKPMVVCLSTRVPVPRGGLGGLLDLLPLHRLTRGLRQRAYRRRRYLAQPNRLAGRMLVPEVVVDDLEQLAQPLLEMLRQPERRARLAADLRQLLQGEGASRRMAGLILEAAAGAQRQPASAGLPVESR
ncbi:MAG TPA: hypothetical protein VNO81_01060 [Candidatus Nitrosotenuis sp.]|jgi:lipid-A-disaccharide synthase|nr:hypothetical protein [Candidatus Nitrosotenuis sp.]